MRSFKPGEMDRSDETKVRILNQFKDEGDRRSVGALYNLINEEQNLSPGRFFRYLSELEQKGYIAHETLKAGDWTVSIIRRL
ncbi:MAG: winged helix-turn-helix domain-containing protein [Calditrichaeota bacterium]|nr:winged helix-turn-helix domain-containing protein [Calditrichota bacterium]